MTSKNVRQRIALERIWRLFEVAEQEFAEHPERSRRYVELARKIGSRNKATIPLELKKRCCKKCGAFLVNGKNSGLAETVKWVEISCLECGFKFKKGKG